MTLLAHPSIPERLAIGDGEQARAYQLRWPSVIDRARYRRAVAESGGRRLGQIGLLAVLTRGVETLMADSPAEIRSLLLARIDAYREQLLACAGKARAGRYDTDEGKQEMVNDALDLAKVAAPVDVIRNEVRNGDPRYAAAEADEATYLQFAGIEGARLFLVGWEGFEGDVQRDVSGATESTLSQIPEGHLSALGNKIESMMALSDAQRKNSGSLPAGPSGSASSTTSTDAHPTTH